jgi:hypothetical protein
MLPTLVGLPSAANNWAQASSWGGVHWAPSVWLFAPSFAADGDHGWLSRF